MVDLLIVTIVNFQERFIRVRDTKEISKSKIKKKNRIRFLVKTVSKKIVYITSLLQLNITGKGIH